MTRRIALVEDDRDLAHLARIHLQDEGYSVDVFHDGAEACRAIEAERFDLLVLDIMLPGMDGLEICRRVRSGSDYVPTLMLTARSSEFDRILGLELGADDYLPKPVSIRELVARVKAIFRRVDALRHPREEEPETLERNGLRIDLPRRRVFRGGEELELTAREFDLLLHFARHPGRVFTRKELLDAVWGYAYEGYEHTVNSHINRLRAKVEPDPSEPEWIQTVWGVGYRFKEG